MGMIPTEIFTLIGKITVLVFAVYVLLIGPHMIIMLSLVILERILTDIVEYFWKWWGGDAENKPEKYADELMWVAINIKNPVRKMRRWYWEKSKWYDKNVLARLPGL